MEGTLPRTPRPLRYFRRAVSTTFKIKVAKANNTRSRTQTFPNVIVLLPEN